MQVDGSKLKFDKTLWVQYEGVDSAEEGDQLVVTARSDDAYVKVFNQFGRLLKLYTFANGHWIDSETGTEPAGFDERQAGRLTAQPAAAPAARKPAAKAKKKKAAAAARSGAAMMMAKRRAKKKPAKKKSAAKSKSGGKRMMAKKKTAKKKTAKKTVKRKAPARKKKAKSRR
jgi:hypothetical protein